mgnify:CR=1 FL=1
MATINVFPIANRQHVEDPRSWSISLGTDYWLGTNPSTAVLAGTAGAGVLLSEYGWTTTALAHVAGLSADFFSAADPGVPGYLQFTAASDLLVSPSVFGGDDHVAHVTRILGYRPTSLNMECYAAFLTEAADEVSSAFGFVQAGASPITAAAAGQFACISSNATNFELNSSAASDAGAVSDNAWHLWRIKITSTGSEWFMDGVSQGSIALVADVFPLRFGCGIVAAGVNTIGLNNVHIWYE